MQTVRRRILEILKRRKSATVGDLARQLDMAPVSVRYHLDILQGDNLIEVAQVRREGSVGRPKQLYSLTSEADDHFPDNFAPLTSSLISLMKKSLPPEQVQGAFCALAHEMAQAFSCDVKADDSLEERLGQVTRFLNERGYLARWEKATPGEVPGITGDAFLLHTFNCPYVGVSTEHRELCQMDLTLIRDLVGHRCCQLDSLADEGSCCTYRIQVGEQADDAAHAEILLHSN